MNRDKSAPASTQSAIPFREGTDLTGTDVLGVLGMTVALLVLALTGAWMARRQGWLRRWGVSPLPETASGSRLKIEQTLRISPRTLLFKIVDGERQWLLVESKDGVQVLGSGARAEEHSDAR